VPVDAGYGPPKLDKNGAQEIDCSGAIVTNSRWL